jgi:hypothetical protein
MLFFDAAVVPMPQSAELNRSRLVLVERQAELGQ